MKKILILLFCAGAQTLAGQVLVFPEKPPIDSSALLPPPTSSPNQCMMWDGSRWKYVDWDVFGGIIFGDWDRDNSDDFSGSYSALTGVPTTFTAAAHTHTKGDITGLTADLGGKFNTPTGNTSEYLRGDGSVGTLDADKDDITISAQGTVYTIDPNTVTNAKLAQAPALTLKGNSTSGTANVADLTFTQVQTVLGRQKLVLASNATNTTITPVATSLTFSVLAGEAYRVDFMGAFTSSVTTTGIGLLLSNTGTVSLNGTVTHALAAQTLTTHSQTASNTVAFSGAGTAGVPVINTTVPLSGRWVLEATTNATITVTFRSEIAGSTITLLSGSKLLVERI